MESRGFAAGSVGLQRLQARKPARCASGGDAKNDTFSRFGGREGHEGRQKIPVVFTAVTKWPSARRSRCTTAAQRAAALRKRLRIVELVRVMPTTLAAERRARRSDSCGAIRIRTETARPVECIGGGIPIAIQRPAGRSAATASARRTSRCAARRSDHYADQRELRRFLPA